MPPRASSIPQPCPQVSPDQTNDTFRLSAGAVRKMTDQGFAQNVGLGMILRGDAVKMSCLPADHRWRPWR